MKTRDRIIDAAIPVFAKKGKHGAHMEEIAKYAHINKAMIYYIFHNKDELYSEVLRVVLEKAWDSFFTFSENEGTNLNSRPRYAEELSRHITSQLKFLSENPNYTRILVDAMSNGEDEIALIAKNMKSTRSDPGRVIKEIIKNGKEKQILRDIDPEQIMISIIGMVAVHFLSRAIPATFDMEIKDEKKFMENRVTSIVDLILNGVMIQGNGTGKKSSKKHTR